jgi:OOP family OmpA-OmpF porin
MKRFLARCAWLGCVLGVSYAKAEDATSLEQFTPAAPGDWSFGVESAEAEARSLAAQLIIDYAHNPLVLRARGERVGSVISHQLLVHAGFGYTLAERLVLHLGSPIVVHQGGDDPVDDVTGVTIASPEGGELGEVFLGARVSLLPPESMANIALAARVFFPTGPADSYVSDESVHARFSAIAGGSGDRLSWAVQPGISVRPTRTLPATDAPATGTALTFGAAADYFVDRRRTVAIGAELLAHNVLVDGAELFSDLGAEILAQGHFRPGRGDFVAALGVGPGLTTTPGVPELRALASVSYAPGTGHEPAVDQGFEGGLP